MIARNAMINFKQIQESNIMNLNSKKQFVFVATAKRLEHIIGALTVIKYGVIMVIHFLKIRFHRNA
jgi:hypothetical protein